MKKNNKSRSFRNNRNNIFAILGDNKKILMPLVFVVAVIITVSIALSANKRAAEMASIENEGAAAATLEVPDGTMQENAYPEVNALVEKYYTASANGDSETIASIYKGLEETELLKAVAAADYIDEYQNITVYTKPGPVAGSYVAYVYNEVKLYDYDKAIPGLETFYICTDENGELYVNVDIADASEIEYLKQINLQADVIDLNNRVATSYNDMVNSDETLAEILTTMRSGLQVSVGEALASSEASASESSEQEETTDEPSGAASSDKQTVTTHTIRATDVVNIRKSDSETADILSKTKKGEEFKQLEALANGWSRIEYKGSVAYVKTEFFEVVGEETVEVENTDAAGTESEEVAATDTNKDTNKDTAENNKDTSSTDSSSKKVGSAATGKMQVTDTVRLRKSESTDSDVLKVIYSGSTVNVIEQYSNGWAKVEYDKKTGYIKSEFLTKE
ncbi:MAG: SH3 domain-containing protein [Butyrivibrio sp.]|nr:SH3 domain-containing protein [Butyrivibrio sp.]